MKLCVLFPGIGYHCQKPLLTLSAQAAENCGYEVVIQKYTNFPDGTKGNEEKMRAAAAHALSQSEEQLADIDFSKYESIVFVGKSIGTAVCLAYREKCGIKAKCVLLTPLEMTFEYPPHDCIAFHGTADPWAATERIEQLCAENGVPIYEYKSANHSLVTGDAHENEVILDDVTAKLTEFLKETL